MEEGTHSKQHSHSFDWIAPDSLNLTPSELPSFVQEYVAEHQDILGDDVVVFDTWEDLEDELEALCQMTYTQQRNWLNSRGLNSPVLNSLIIHDSVYADVCYNFGIDFDALDLETLDDEYTEEQEMEAMEDAAFDQYDQILSDDYSEYVKTSVDSNGIITLSPLGRLDEQVFCNTQDLFICEGVVVKYLSDGIMSCPINEFNAELAAANSISDVEYLGVSPYRISVDPSWRNDRNFSSDSGEHPKYITKVNFHINVTGVWFGLERKCTSMCATNYHKKSDGSYRSVPCLTKINAYADVECIADNFNTGWWFMGGGMTYYRYIQFNLRNKHGVVMSETWPLN